MNCTNCGATLSEISGRDHLRCEFCQTLHFLSEHDWSADRMVDLEQVGDQECPICAKSLHQAKLEKHPVQFCRGCRGILIEQERFAELVDSRRREYQGPADTPSPMDPTELKRIVACPKCTRTMETYPYYGPGNVVLDSCFRCRIIWLDHGELGSLERAPGLR